MCSGMCIRLRSTYRDIALAKGGDRGEIEDLLLEDPPTAMGAPAKQVNRKRIEAVLALVGSRPVWVPRGGRLRTTHLELTRPLDD